MIKEPCVSHPHTGCPEVVTKYPGGFNTSDGEAATTFLAPNTTLDDKGNTKWRQATQV